MKKLIRKTLSANTYLSLYILLQGILSLLFFVPACLHDKNSQDLFYHGMSAIYANSSSRFEVILNSVPLMTELFSDFLYQIIILSGMIIIFIFCCRQSGLSLHLPPRHAFFSAFLLYCAGIGLNLVVSTVIHVLCILFPTVNILNTSADSIVYGNFPSALLAVGIIGPVTEEIVFRHGMICSLKSINPIYALFYSGILFGLMHVNPVQVIYAGVLGLLFGWLYLKTEKLSIPIMLHIGINSSSVIISAFASMLF